MLSINAERFEESFETYSEIGETDAGGLNRVALTDADRRVRDQFVSDLESLDVDVWIDEIGNIFARREGAVSGAPPILIGSHLDSQPMGGRYDGQLGVLCALETIRILDDEGITTDRPIEIVNWTDEEGARFNMAPLGSGTFTGEFDLENALAASDADGTTVKDALTTIGYDGDTPCEPHELAAYLELHIEQGRVLERNGTPIGNVRGVTGLDWFDVHINGVADHAGTTPMSQRQDPVVTASTVIQQLKSLCAYFDEDIVVTVGDVDVSPGSINVIPDECSFTIDIRCYDDKMRAEAIEWIEAELRAVAAREQTEHELQSLNSVDHTEFAPYIRQTITETVDDLGIGETSLVSRAFHDAMYLSKVTDVGMIFVPSVDGKSHTEEEYTHWEDVLAGASVYTNTAYRLAQIDDE